MLNIIAGLSSLLFVATGVMWVPSYWVADVVVWRRSLECTGVVSGSGVLYAFIRDCSGGEPSIRYETERPSDPADDLQRIPIPMTAFAGFCCTHGIVRHPGTPFARVGVIGMPHWFGMLMFAVSPVIRIR